ncbi:MAG: Clp protease ClpP [Caulobacteraceae bacterium]|nr:Clp protease ClpP [Caulobacteraceae bacterium]
MASKQTKQKYFKVVSNRANNIAELYLYGYIGQRDCGFDDDDENDESLTDLSVVKAINELQNQYSRINIHINSPGGDVMHGDAIISAMDRCSAEVHTYVDGIAASMAAEIWIACPNRHMSKTSKIMVHCTSTIAWGNAKELRAEAQALDVFDSVCITRMAEACGKKEDEIRANYYDGNDHWMSAADCVALGLIPAVEDYTPADQGTMVTPDPDMEQMTYEQLCAQFYSNRTGTSLLNQIAQQWNRLFRQNTAPTAAEPVAILEPKNVKPMDANAFETALSNGQITVEQAAEILARVQAAAAPQAPEEAPVTRAEFEQMMARIEQLGAQPGATQTRLSLGSDVEKLAEKTFLQTFNESLAKSAAENDTVVFVK